MTRNELELTMRRLSHKPSEEWIEAVLLAYDAGYQRGRNAGLDELGETVQTALGCLENRWL